MYRYRTHLPTLLSSSPSDNAASTRIDQNIILTFNEDVVAGSGDIELFEGNGTLVEAFTVSSSMISGSTVTINPAANFKPNTSYYLHIPATAFVDASGNSYAGITNAIDFDFTTRQRTPTEAFTEVKDDIGLKDEVEHDKADPQFCVGNDGCCIFGSRACIFQACE